MRDLIVILVLVGVIATVAVLFLGTQISTELTYISGAI
jgi:hypothetical protein